MTGQDEDAAWRAIVENYGEQPEVEQPTTEPVPEPAPSFDPAGDEPEPLAWEDEGHYVPPDPPPLPHPEPRRMLAWWGVFGVPLVLVGSVLVSIPVPQWLGLILVAWFIGGFGYLVATMRQGGPGDGGDGYDNGAVV